MNPEEMTNEELVKHHADARAFAENSDYDLAVKGSMKVSEDCASELLRRLNEVDALRKEVAELKDRLYENSSLAANERELHKLQLDALRKENEELRKDKARLDFIEAFFGRVHPDAWPAMNGPYNMMGSWKWDFTEGLSSSYRGALVLGHGETLREAIDAARLAKESEAKKGQHLPEVANESDPYSDDYSDMDYGDN